MADSTIASSSRSLIDGLLASRRPSERHNASMPSSIRGKELVDTPTSAASIDSCSKTGVQSSYDRYCSINILKGDAKLVYVSGYMRSAIRRVSKGSASADRSLYSVHLCRLLLSPHQRKGSSRYADTCCKDREICCNKHVFILRRLATV